VEKRKVMPTIDDVAATWVGAAELSPTEELVLTEVFWRLLRGAPVAIADLRDSLDLSPEGAEEVLAGLEAKRCLRRRKDGAVIAARGLMVQPSRHQLITGEGRVYTQCAVDAIGIPAALGVEGTIEDRCAFCDRPIRVRVTPSGDISSQPEAAVIVMVRPDTCVEEGIPRMCRETNLFCSPDHATVWLREQATLPGAIGAPQDAVGVGRVLWGRFARGAGHGIGSNPKHGHRL
jgi:hypothetical protein